MSYEEMLSFLEKMKDLEPVDLLVFVQQIKEELLANNEFVKGDKNYQYDFVKADECIKDLSNIIGKIEKKLVILKIKSIVERYNNLDERDQLRVLSNIDGYISNIEERNHKSSTRKH